MTRESGPFEQLAGAILVVGRALLRAPRRELAPWLWALVVATATALAYEDKWNLQALVAHGGSVVADRAASFAAVVGNGYAIAFAVLAVLVTARWHRRPALTATAIAVGAVGLWCWLLADLGAMILAERRPAEGGAMRFFALDGHGISGHAAGAALLYWPVRDVLSARLPAGWRRLSAGGVVAWALFVGWSRVWLGRHFVWNVMLGFLIGALTSRVGTRALRDGR